MVKKISATRFNEQPVSPLDALIRSLDMVAVEMESKWGSGVLHNLCSPETSARFMRVKDSLDQAIHSGDYDMVKAKSESLAKGWRMMDKEATEKGDHLPFIGNLWFCTSPKQGVEYIVTRHEGDASRVAKMYPKAAVYSLEDIVRMIENGSVVNLDKPAKDMFVAKLKERLATEKFLDDECPF